MNLDSSTLLAGLKLKNRLMNAAYIGSKTASDIETLIRAKTGAVVVGSISVKPRLANPGKGYWRHKEGFYSLNSYGMPNGGIEYYREQLPIIVKKAHKFDKPVVVNLIGFSLDDWAQLILLAQDSGVDMVELNFGCPNIWSNGEQKGIMSYHPESIKETLEFIKKQNPTVKISVKISPLPPDILRGVAKVIVRSGVVSAITATNSYPNAMVNSGTKFEDESDLAGMSGRALKPISLGVVKQLHELLPPDIEIIGCGGISSINDVNDYLEAGATAVQIATALVDTGPEVFEKLLSAKI